MRSDTRKKIFWKTGTVFSLSLETCIKQNLYTFITKSICLSRPAHLMQLFLLFVKRSSFFFQSWKHLFVLSCWHQWHLNLLQRETVKSLSFETCLTLVLFCFIIASVFCLELLTPVTFLIFCKEEHKTGVVNLSNFLHTVGFWGSVFGVSVLRPQTAS